MADTKSRVDLKSYFVKNAIPTQGHFEELIDASLNQRDDNIFKDPNGPVSLVGFGDEGSRKKVLQLFSHREDPGPTFVLSLRPRTDDADPETGRRGLSIGNTVGKSFLFVDADHGAVGVGTSDPAPNAQLHVMGRGSNTAKIFIEGGETDDQTINFLQTGIGQKAVIGWDTIDKVLKLTADSTFRGETGISITAEGNVGVGESRPAARLEVKGDLRATEGALFSSIISIGRESHGRLERPFESIQLDRLNVLRICFAENERFTFDNEGNFEARGNKKFRIDHPVAPEARDLVHSCIEGPEVAVFYRGEGLLDSGKAEVVLPAYFEALTRPEGRTVQLTPKLTDGETASVLAASAVVNGRFLVKAIGEARPEQRFYWEVKAVRADLAPLDAEPFKDRK